MGKKLHEVLIAWMSCRQLQYEFELHCVHRTDGTCGDDMLKRLEQHNEEQRGFGQRQAAEPEYKKDNLQCLLSVHH